MRRWTALLALLVLAVSACGSQNINAASSSSTPSSSTPSSSPQGATPTGPKKLTKALLAIENQPKYEPSDWGYIAIDQETGEVLAAQNPDKMFDPGSTMKSFAVSAALKAYGDDYKITTPVYRVGEVSGRVLNGNLVLVGSGDLSFGLREQPNGSLYYENMPVLDHSYANLGITPMIGQNDQSGEVFTLNNARDLLSFANANGVGRLAFWSVGRDQPCPGGAGGGASPNCSSIAQNSLDFTNIFNGAAGGPPPPPPPSPTPTPTGSCSAPPWNAATAYNGGAVVSFNGHQYSAKWWTQGEEPDTHSGQWDVWADKGACSGGGTPGPGPSPSTSPTPTPSGTGHYAAWQAGHAYAVGDLVSYAGHDYRCLQAHTSQVGWEPPNVPALWQALN